MADTYAPSVSTLLSLGAVEVGEPWLRYDSFGITAAHVGDLVGILRDEVLAAAPPDSDEAWAPRHAWRALGQLRAEAAIEPLLNVLLRNDDDWAREEIPEVLGMIGPVAIEPVTAELARLAPGSPTPIAAYALVTSLENIVEGFPETRGRVVDVLQRQLGWWARQGEELNAMLVWALVELNAVEAAPLMEEAFADSAVDEAYGGDWEDAQVDLGLIPERITPHRWSLPSSADLALPWFGGLGADRSRGPRGDADAAKRRRKAQKQSRQRNRRRKKR